MNTHLFNDLMNVYRKNVSDTWSAEDFVGVGFVRGKLSPAGGSMGTTSGKVNSNATHIFYCSANADILTGDIMYDKYGRSHVVEYMQPSGIAGDKDHMEVSLVVS